MAGGSKQTTTQNSEPWKEAQPALKLGLKDAQKLYKDGVGGERYTGSTVIPWSNQTMAGMNGLQNLAKNSGVSLNARDIIANGGFNDTQQYALQGMANAARRNYDTLKGLGDNGLTDIQDNAYSALKGNRADLKSILAGLGSNGLTRDQDAAMSGYQSGRANVNDLLKSLGANGLTSDQDIALGNYRNTATSKFDYSPDFQSVLDASLADARTGVNANAASAGRYGSGVAQGVMADRLGRISNEARLGEYRDWQNRKDAATGNLANLAQTGVGNRTGALQLGQSFDSAIAGLGQTGLGNRMQGNQAQQAINGTLANLGQQGLSNKMGLNEAGMNIQGSRFNAGQAGLANMANAYDLAQAPYKTQMQVGGMYEDLASRLKNDELRLFNDRQNAPWDQIARLNAIAGGAGQMGGTQTSSQPGQNPFLTALGYGATGLGTLGSIF